MSSWYAYAAALAASGVAFAYWSSRGTRKQARRRRATARRPLGDLEVDVAQRRLFAGGLVAALKHYRDSGCVLMIAVDPEGGGATPSLAAREVWTHSSIWSSSGGALVSADDEAAMADRTHRIVPLRIQLGTRECKALLKLFKLPAGTDDPFLLFLAGGQLRTWMFSGGASHMSPQALAGRIKKVATLLRAQLHTVTGVVGAGAAAAAVAPAAAPAAAADAAADAAVVDPATQIVSLPWPVGWELEQRKHAEIILSAHGDMIVQLLVREGSMAAGDVVVERHPRRGAAAAHAAATAAAIAESLAAAPASPGASIDGMSAEDAALIASLLESDQRGMEGPGAGAGTGAGTGVGAAAAAMGGGAAGGSPVPVGRRDMVAHQDAEYEASLAEDRRKEAERAEEAEAQAKVEADRELSEALELSRELDRQSAADKTRARVPEEPAAGDADIANVRFKLPTGCVRPLSSLSFSLSLSLFTLLFASDAVRSLSLSLSLLLSACRSKAQRRFRCTETLATVRDFFDIYLLDHPDACAALTVGEYALSTTFPRRTFDLSPESEDLALTVHELGLAPSGVLMVQDLTS